MGILGGWWVRGVQNKILKRNLKMTQWRRKREYEAWILEDRFGGVRGDGSRFSADLWLSDWRLVIISACVGPVVARTFLWQDMSRLIGGDWKKRVRHIPDVIWKETILQVSLRINNTLAEWLILIEFGIPYFLLYFFFLFYEKNLITRRGKIFCN